MSEAMQGFWLSKFIFEVEAELALVEQSGAFRWADANGETRHARAMEQLDYALAHQMGPADRLAAAKEYKAAMVDLFARYKAHKGQNESKRLLTQLRLELGGS